MTRRDRDLLIGPAIELTLGGVRWDVVFDHLTLLRLERATGLDVLNGGLNPYRLDSRTLHTLVQVTLEASEQKNVAVWTGVGPRMLEKLMEGFQQAWKRDMPVPRPPRAPGTTGTSTVPIVTNWLEAWANGRQLLHLSDEEWLFYTPRMVQLLSQDHLEALRQQEWMLAQIATNVINWSMSAPRTPARPESYMLHPWDNIPGEHIQSGEDVLRMFKSFPGLDPAGRQAISELLN